jgi:hypothetical protein
MATAPAIDNLIRVRTALDVVTARDADLRVRIRQRRVVEIAKLKAAAIARGHRFRDLVQTAPARHAAVLAARHGVEPAAVGSALLAFARAALREISSGPGRERLAAEIRGQLAP